MSYLKFALIALVAVAIANRLPVVGPLLKG